MNRNNYILLIISLLCYKKNLWGQQLDLSTCLKMADTANVVIRNAQLDVKINDRSKSAYLSARLPKLTFNGDYKFNAIIPGQVVPAAFFGGTPGTFSTVQFGVPFNLSSTLQLSQVLYNPQVEYGISVLRINAEIVAIQEKMTSQEIKYQVASTFFNLQGIKKQLDFLESNLRNTDKLITNMDALLKQGLVIQTDLDKLSIQKISLLNSLGTLKATHDQLEMLLKILIGMKPDGKLEVFPDETVEQSLLRDKDSRSYPEIDLVAAQQKLNKEEHKGNAMAYLPSLSFYAAYNYNYNMKPQDNFRKGIEGAFVGLRVDWTLFDGTEKYYKQKVNLLTAEKLSNEKALLLQQLDLKAAHSKRQIEVQTNSLSLAKEQLKLAQRIYDQSIAKLAQGTISANDMISADNGLQQAQTNVIAAYLQLRQAELDYLKSTGNIND